MNTPPDLIEYAAHVGHVLDYNIIYNPLDEYPRSEYEIEIAALGIDIGDIKISMHNGSILIKSRNTDRYDSPGPNYIVKNFKYLQHGKPNIESSFKLAVGYEVKAVELKLGILRLYVGKIYVGPVSFEINSSSGVIQTLNEGLCFR